MKINQSTTIKTAHLSPSQKLQKTFRNLAFIACVAVATPSKAVEATVLVQLIDYGGESAYFSLYLVDENGRYEHTLWVSGDEEKYFADLPRWWKYLARKPQELDAITGASTKGGDRSVLHLEIEDKFIDSGYSLRVETAVEDQLNHPIDVEVALNAENIGAKTPGSGYVRHIRFKW